MSNSTIHKRIYGLDILRAMAIFYVMLSHGYAYSQSVIEAKYYRWLTTDGVGLFFVLSGFLIGGILIRTINEQPFRLAELKHFWIRRWFRTLPNYYLILTILVGCYYIAHKHLPPRLIEYYTFTQCFAWPHPLFFGEAWSLAVEEWFYLLVPAAIFIMLRLRNCNRRHLLSLILFVLIAGTLARTIKIAGHDYIADGSFGSEVSKVVVMRMDSIMYGMLAAWVSIYHPARWLKYRNALFAAGLALLIGVNFIPSLYHYSYVFYTVAGVGTMCLLPRLSTVTQGKGVMYKVFTFISLISYSMYLTNHMIVQRAIMPKLLAMLHINVQHNAVHGLIALAMFWGLTILLSYMLYRFWEIPMMRLRDRIKPAGRIIPVEVETGASPKAATID